MRPQIELISLEMLAKSNRNDITTPHRTDFYHIFLFEDCSPTHLVDFNRIRVKPRSVLFIDRGRVHQFDRSLDYRGRVLVFTDDFFCITEKDTKVLRTCLLFRDLDDSPAFLPEENVRRQIDEVAGQIETELRFPNEVFKIDILQNCLHNLLLIAERGKKPRPAILQNRGAKRDHTVLFTDIVEQNFRSHKTVGHYAGKLHISEKLLVLATTTTLGKTPKQIIRDRVLLEAKRFLAHGNLCIKEIGYELGFDEPTNFIKYFRKHTGITPTNFREKFPLS